MNITPFITFLENQQDGEQTFSTTELREILNDYQTKVKRWQQEEQTLNIGIMGQVKAGKSSFLNALLFEGLPILPEAATPKTANLTRVIYGENFSLEVEYYSADEWREIRELASRKGDSDQEKVARELLAMARHHGEHFNGREKETIQADCLASLQGLLNTYTGNDGEFTALVKSTVLTIPDEKLKGFAVVDTPGMNDPVQSRSQKTRDYMAQSDVVFFLSRCSQFFDESDVQLLFQQLPSKGVKRLVIVAGQFDSAIQDDGYDRDSLDETMTNIRTRLQRVAGDKIATLRKHQPEAENPRLAGILNELREPIFASTFAWGFARWPEEKWGSSMHHTHQEIQQMAQSCWGNPITNEQWLQIANFEALTSRYRQAREEREELLREQRESVERETAEQLEQWRSDFIQAIQQRIHLLDSQDMQSLADLQKGFTHRISAIAAELAGVIDDVRLHAEHESRQMLMRLEDDRREYARLNTRTGSYEERHSYQRSTSKWYNPFSWGSSETAYHTVTRHYEYILVADAIEQVRDYGEQCASSLRQHFNRLISPLEIRSKLRKALLNHMNTASHAFDPTLFRSTLDGVIKTLKLPTLHMALDDVASGFPGVGEIKQQEEMESLRRMQGQALNSLLAQLRSRLENGVADVFGQMEQLRASLEDTLTTSIQGELTAVQSKLAVKVEQKAVWQQLEETVRQL